MAVLDGGRFPLIATRSAQFGEAGDDHQRDLASELERRGLARTIIDPALVTADDLLGTLDTDIVKTDNPPPFRLNDEPTGARASF